jgi:hypothetical protein
MPPARLSTPAVRIASVKSLSSDAPPVGLTSTQYRGVAWPKKGVADWLGHVSGDPTEPERDQQNQGPEVAATIRDFFHTDGRVTLPYHRRKIGRFGGSFRMVYTTLFEGDIAPFSSYNAVNVQIP